MKFISEEDKDNVVRLYGKYKSITQVRIRTGYGDKKIKDILIECNIEIVPFKPNKSFLYGSRYTNAVGR